MKTAPIGAVFVLAAFGGDSRFTNVVRNIGRRWEKAETLKAEDGRPRTEDGRPRTEDGKKGRKAETLKR